MSWLDDDFDPDSATGRDELMQVLEDAESGRVAQGVSESACGSEEPLHVAEGHSYHAGPPRLVCSVPWGLMLLREADPTHTAAPSKMIKTWWYRMELVNDVRPKQHAERVA